MKKLLAVLGVLGFLYSTPVCAQATDDASRAAARDMGYAGVEAFQRGDYPTALDKLSRAYRILRVPTLGLWLSRALEKSGKLVEAGERYLEVTRLEVSGSDAAVHRKAQNEAETERSALLARIPSLVLTVKDGNEAELEVSIDGTAISSAFLGEKRLVNPGKHEVAAKRGGEQFAASVTVQESEVKSVEIAFDGTSAARAATPHGEATPASASGSAADSPAATGSSGSKTLAWTSIAVGGVGLVVGGVTGIMAMSKRDSLDCPDDSCTSDKTDEVDSYNTLRTVSTVGFIAGAAFAAAGGVLLFTGNDEKASARAHVSPFIGLNRVGVGGRF